MSSLDHALLMSALAFINHSSPVLLPVLMTRPFVIQLLSTALPSSTAKANERLLLLAQLLAFLVIDPKVFVTEIFGLKDCRWAFCKGIG